MREESLLSAALDSRDAFETIRTHMDGDMLSPLGKFWWPMVVAWYERDSAATGVDRALLLQQGKRAIKNPKHEESLLGFIEGLPPAPSADNTALELVEMKRYQTGMKLASMLASGDADREAVRAQLAAYEELLNATGALTIDLGEIDDEQMIQTLDRKNAIPMAPQRLNARTGGGAVPSDMVFIFGRPNSGKTLLAAHLTASWAKRGHKVLYIVNEEDASKTRQRVISNLSGATRDEFYRQTEKAIRIARKSGLDNAVFLQPTPCTTDAVREAIAKHKPQILVIDQLRTMAEGFAGKSMTEKLDRAAIWMRGIVKQNRLVGVGITQAGDKTEKHGQEPPLILTMSDIDSSRTGIPAHGDLIIGVGNTSDTDMRGERFLSLPKNKLGDTQEGVFVRVDTARSRILED